MGKIKNNVATNGFSGKFGCLTAEVMKTFEIAYTEEEVIFTW